jgi:hypothetical protein
MIAFTPIVGRELIVSESWVMQNLTRTSEYMCQIITVEIGDTYGFKSIVVFRARVRCSDGKYHLWFHHSKFATSTIRWPMAFGDGTYPRTR